MEISDLHWVRALLVMSFVALVCFGSFRFIKWHIEKREEEENDEENSSENCS